jgi:hypothetical protein
MINSLGSEWPFSLVVEEFDNENILQILLSGRSKNMLSEEQRSNLEKLATYLESLPPDYNHFDMSFYADHSGDCDLLDDPLVLDAIDPEGFLSNCGTVACAVGHGPAAGILMLPSEIKLLKSGGNFAWGKYVGRAFIGYDFDMRTDAFDFLFASGWSASDNSHYGAAARIRYFLENGVPDWNLSARDQIDLYSKYRKDAAET